MPTRNCVFVAGGGKSYYRPFEEFGHYCESETFFLECPENISLVLFTGGADISPYLYDEEKSHMTDTPYVYRDASEFAVFLQARKHGIPMVGVCRGAQFLCAMAGGKLIQHVNGHHRNHFVRTNDDRTVLVSSCHHQMMLPNEDAEVVAWAEPHQSSIYVGGGDQKIDVPERECEICYFPEINALSIQHHPEMMPTNSEGYMLAEELCNQYLFERN